jgi:hypothetical protein
VVLVRGLSDAAAADARRLESHLVEHAPAYFADLAGGAQVALRRRNRRATSTLYEFELTNGHGGHSVLVKVPAAGSAAPAPLDALRRGEAIDPMRMSEAEYAALALIHRSFGGLGDPRFGTVAPLDLLEEDRALVMSKAADPPLGVALLRAHRLRPGAPPDDLQVVLRNTGAWLARYHGLPAPPEARLRQPTRSEFIAFIGRLTAYLAVHDGRPALFEEAEARIAAVARARLPPELPLGVAHGDFAPRNVLIGAGGRVTVIDATARWSAPIYDDLGDFVFALRTARPHVYTGGLLFGSAALAAWEDAFLDGYFDGGPRPLAALKLFEAQALLNKWAAVRSRAPARRSVPLAGGLRVRAWSAFLARYLRRLMRELDALADAGGG